MHVNCSYHCLIAIYDLLSYFWEQKYTELVHNNFCWFSVLFENLFPHFTLQDLSLFVLSVFKQFKIKSNQLQQAFCSALVSLEFFFESLIYCFEVLKLPNLLTYWAIFIWCFTWNKIYDVLIKNIKFKYLYIFTWLFSIYNDFNCCQCALTKTKIRLKFVLLHDAGMICL